MAAVAALFSFTTSPNVKKLLGWKQGDEEEKWALRAIEALEKKLRKNKGLFSDLSTKISSQDIGCISVKLNRLNSLKHYNDLFDDV